MGMIRARFCYKGISFKIRAYPHDYYGRTYRAFFKDRIVYGFDLPTLKKQIKEYCDRVLLYK